VFRPPSIGRPILRAKECSACCPFQNARRAGLRSYSHREQPPAWRPNLVKQRSLTFQQPWRFFDEHEEVQVSKLNFISTPSIFTLGPGIFALKRSVMPSSG